MRPVPLGGDVVVDLCDDEDEEDGAAAPPPAAVLAAAACRPLRRPAASDGLKLRGRSADGRSEKPRARLLGPGPPAPTETARQRLPPSPALPPAAAPAAAPARPSVTGWSLDSVGSAAPSVGRHRPRGSPPYKRQRRGDGVLTGGGAFGGGPGAAGGGPGAAPGGGNGGALRGASCPPALVAPGPAEPLSAPPPLPPEAAPAPPPPPPPPAANFAAAPSAPAPALPHPGRPPGAHRPSPRGLPPEEPTLSPAKLGEPSVFGAKPATAAAAEPVAAAAACPAPPPTTAAPPPPAVYPAPAAALADFSPISAVTSEALRLHPGETECQVAENRWYLQSRLGQARFPPSLRPLPAPPARLRAAELRRRTRYTAIPAAGETETDRGVPAGVLDPAWWARREWVAFPVAAFGTASPVGGGGGGAGAGGGGASSDGTGSGECRFPKPAATPPAATAPAATPPAATYTKVDSPPGDQIEPQQAPDRGDAKTCERASRAPPGAELNRVPKKDAQEGRGNCGAPQTEDLEEGLAPLHAPRGLSGAAPVAPFVKRKHLRMLRRVMKAPEVIFQGLLEPPPFLHAAPPHGRPGAQWPQMDARHGCAPDVCRTCGAAACDHRAFGLCRHARCPRCYYPGHGPSRCRSFAPYAWESAHLAAAQAAYESAVPDSKTVCATCGLRGHFLCEQPERAPAPAAAAPPASPTPAAGGATSGDLNFPSELLSPSSVTDPDGDEFAIHLLASPTATTHRFRMFTRAEVSEDLAQSAAAAPAAASHFRSASADRRLLPPHEVLHFRSYAGARNTWDYPPSLAHPRWDDCYVETGVDRSRYCRYSQGFAAQPLSPPAPAAPKLSRSGAAASQHSADPTAWNNGALERNVYYRDRAVVRAASATESARMSIRAEAGAL